MRPEKPVSSPAEVHDMRVHILPEGREISFRKECLEPVTISRKINDQAWKEVAKNVRTPFVDSDKFQTPVTLHYKVSFGGNESIAKVNLPKDAKD